MEIIQNLDGHLPFLLVHSEKKMIIEEELLLEAQHLLSKVFLCKAEKI